MQIVGRKGALTQRDLPRLLGSDATLSPAGRTGVVWTSLFTAARMRLELVDGALQVEAVPERYRNECLAKLRHIAGRLDARVLDDAGQDLTVAPPAPQVRRGMLARIGAGMLFVLVLPAALVLYVLRLPWLLWKALWIK